MADKQAIVYIVDQGASTGKSHNGREESDLDYAMRYVWDKIATTMAANRATWNLAILGLRSDDSDNPLCSDEAGADSEGYENISLLKALGPMGMNDLETLQKALKPSRTDSGDAISAIVIAVSIIEKFTTLKSGKPGKFLRRIVLVTDGYGAMDVSDLDSIAGQINEVGIELIIIGVDFDDPEFGFKEEDKPPIKAHNETLLKSLVEKCNSGIFGTIAEAVQNLSIPEVKTTRPYSTFKGPLALGDFTKYPETAMYIDVERYFKTHVAKPVTASSFVTRASATNEEAGASSNTLQEDTDMADSPDLSAVRSIFTYKVNDPTAAGGKKDVPRDDLAKGFEYGRTAVHISSSEENVTKIESIQSFSIIGFIPSDKYERYLNMGESSITVASSINDKAIMALSSFIHALHELDSYAVARIVTKDGKDPLIIILAPLIEPDLEALVDVPLPFAEDVRMYRFPPLDRVITTSGATVTKHRNLPSEELTNAMSDYVDAMDLSTFDKDDEGQPTEYMTIDDTYSPAVHQINQAIRKRAIHPDEPVDPPAEILMKWSKPPQELVSSNSSELKTLIDAAAVKKVPPKQKGRRLNRETIKPLSGLDVDSLLDRDTRKKISIENSIPEFKQIVSSATSDSKIHDAAKQMSDIICRLVKDSVGDSGYSRALENMKVLKAELMSLEMPSIYNDFIREFKQRLLAGELGGDRREFFFSIRGAKLGLIDNKAIEFCDVSEEDAAQFYSLKMELPSRAK